MVAYYKLLSPADEIVADRRWENEKEIALERAGGKLLIEKS